MQPQTVWGALIGAYFAAQALASGTYLAAYALALDPKCRTSALTKIGVISSPLFLFLGLIFLVLDLGSPANALYVFERPFTSVTSLGAIVIVLALVVTGVHALSYLMRKLSMQQSKTLWALGVALSCMVAWYPGAMLWEKAGVPFWNTPLLPLIFLLTGLCAGVGLLSFIGCLVPKKNEDRYALLRNANVALFSLAITLLLVSLLVALANTSSEEAARASAVMLLTGPLSAAFLLLGILIGLITPICINFLAVKRRITSGALLVIGGLCAVVGACYLRYCILLAGVLR